MSASITYDEASDTLYINFASGEKATGIELNDHVLLRVNKDQRRAIGITLFEYSLLVQHTEIGPRSFPLNGIAVLSPEMRELVYEIVHQLPVSDYLALSAYTVSANETIPILAVKELPTEAVSS